MDLAAWKARVLATCSVTNNLILGVCFAAVQMPPRLPIPTFVDEASALQVVREVLSRCPLAVLNIDRPIYRMLLDFLFGESSFLSDIPLKILVQTYNQFIEIRSGI